MANMSYCRYQNTLIDLRDCWGEMDYEEPETLDLEERKARRHLIALCKDIAQFFQGIEE